MIALIKSMILVYSVSLSYNVTNTMSIVDWENRIYNEHKMSEAIETMVDVELYTPKKFFYVGGSTANFSIPGFPRFTPIENHYIFKTGVSVGKFTIGYEHLCIHPVGSVNKKGLLISNRYGAHSKVFISFSNR